MSEVEPELGAIGRPALVAVDELVAVAARALEAAVDVGAQLVAEAPFLALVAI